MTSEDKPPSEQLYYCDKKNLSPPRTEIYVQCDDGTEYLFEKTETGYKRSVKDNAATFESSQDICRIFPDDSLAVLMPVSLVSYKVKSHLNITTLEGEHKHYYYKDGQWRKFEQ